MRQTNVIWVAVLAAEQAVDMLEAETPRSIEALVSRNLQNTPMHAKVSKKKILSELAGVLNNSIYSF